MQKYRIEASELKNERYNFQRFQAAIKKDFGADVSFTSRNKKGDGAQKLDHIIMLCPDDVNPEPIIDAIKAFDLKESERGDREAEAKQVKFAEAKRLLTNPKVLKHLRDVIK